LPLAACRNLKFGICFWEFFLGDRVYFSFLPINRHEGLAERIFYIY
jgi:hypothetical protein